MDSIMDSKFEVSRAIQSSIKNWYAWYMVVGVVHYTIGIIGLLAATLVASGSTFLTSQQTAIAGIVSAICIGVVGFVQPGAKANVFFQGYVELRRAMVKYELDKDVDAAKAGEELYNALGRGYEIIKQVQPVSKEVPPKPNGG